MRYKEDIKAIVDGDGSPKEKFEALAAKFEEIQLEDDINNLKKAELNSYLEAMSGQIKIMLKDATLAEDRKAQLTEIQTAIDDTKDPAKENIPAFKRRFGKIKEIIGDIYKKDVGKIIESPKPQEILETLPEDKKLSDYISGAKDDDLKKIFAVVSTEFPKALSAKLTELNVPKDIVELISENREKALYFIGKKFNIADFAVQAEEVILQAESAVNVEAKSPKSQEIPAATLSKHEELSDYIFVANSDDSIEPIKNTEKPKDQLNPSGDIDKDENSRRSSISSEDLAGFSFNEPEPKADTKLDLNPGDKTDPKPKDQLNPSDPVGEGEDSSKQQSVKPYKGRDLVIYNMLLATNMSQKAMADVMSDKNSKYYKGAAKLADNLLMQSGFDVNKKPPLKGIYGFRKVDEEKLDALITNHINGLDEQSLTKHLRETSKYLMGQAMLYGNSGFLNSFRGVEKNAFNKLTSAEKDKLIGEWASKGSNDKLLAEALKAECPSRWNMIGEAIVNTVDSLASYRNLAIGYIIAAMVFPPAAPVILTLTLFKAAIDLGEGMTKAASFTLNKLDQFRYGLCNVADKLSYGCVQLAETIGVVCTLGFKRQDIIKWDKENFPPGKQFYFSPFDWLSGAKAQRENISVGEERLNHVKFYKDLSPESLNAISRDREEKKELSPEVLLKKVREQEKEKQSEKGKDGAEISEKVRGEAKVLTEKIAAATPVEIGDSKTPSQTPPLSRQGSGLSR